MPYQTRWLDDDEQELWRLLLGAVRKIDRGMEETLKAGGEVSASEFAVLVALSEARNNACACTNCARSWSGTAPAPPIR